MDMYYQTDGLEIMLILNDFRHHTTSSIHGTKLQSFGPKLRVETVNDLDTGISFNELKIFEVRSYRNRLLSLLLLL